MPSTVLTDLRQKLNITWQDDATEARLKTILDDAEATLKMKLGAEDINVFSAPGPERTLLLNRCMYEWNNCLDEFDSRYMNDIMQLRAKHEVLQNAKEQDENVQ